MSKFFKEATSTGSRLKLYVYGEQGTGKTFTAIQFPNPAVIDTQKGTGHYADDFTFHLLDSDAYGKDPADPDFIEEVIEHLSENPGKFKTLVIDSMTDVSDKIVQKRINYRKAKTGKTEYEMNPQDWGYVKGYIKKFIHDILALDMNIVATAESANEYKQSSGDFLEIEGTRPDGHKKIPHIFDVVIELVKEGDQRRAFVKKDRTRKLPDTFLFSYDELMKYLDKKSIEKPADKDVQATTFSERPERSVEIKYKGKKIKTAGVKSEVLEEIEELSKEIDDDKIKQILRNDYLSNSVLDLKNDEAKLLVKQLTELLQPQS